MRAVTLLVGEKEVAVSWAGTLQSGKNIYFFADMQGAHFVCRKGVRPSGRAYRTAAFVPLIDVAEAEELQAVVVPIVVRDVARLLRNYRAREKGFADAIRNPDRARDWPAIRSIAARELEFAQRLETALQQLRASCADADESRRDG